MTKPEYRLRVFAPRSVDPTEATVLVPAAGAAHSDPFQVATIDGIAGYKPYLMGEPVGRTSRIDYKSKKLDVGSWTWQLMDKSLSSNLIRWWTAYVGNLKGLARGRIRIEADESLDGGASWPRHSTCEFVGWKSQKNLVTLSTRDRIETLKMPAFVGAPHSSIAYAVRTSLLPVGVYGDYGPFTGVGSINAALYAPGTYAPSTARLVVIDPSYTGVALDWLFLTDALRQALGAHDVVAVNPDFSIAAPLPAVVPDFTHSTVRCHLTNPGAGTSGDFKVSKLFVRHGGGNRETRQSGIVAYRPIGFFIGELDAGDVNYLAMPAAGTAVTIQLFADSPVTEKSPLLLTDADDLTYISDLAAGKFSALFRSPDSLPPGKAYGDVKRSVSTNGLGALANTRPAKRRIQKKETPVIDEIERVCLENNWAPFLDELGQLNVVDLNLPQSLAGIPTITDTDLVADQPGEWEEDPAAAIARIEFTLYEEELVALPDAVGDHIVINEIPHPLRVLFASALDFGDVALKIDARGYRSFDGEMVGSQTRSKYLEGRLIETANQMRRPHETGAWTLPLVGRRTATINGLTRGGLALLQVAWVPDPSTHVRSGTRLVRILEKTARGPTWQLQLLDVAINGVAAVPILGAPAQQAGNTFTGVTSAITHNANNDPVEVRYAITATSVVVAPGNTDPLWTTLGDLVSGATAIIRGVEIGRRIWVQGRSFPIGPASPYLPSAWVAANAPGYVDTATIAAPSALNVISKTDRTIRLGWTNAVADAMVQILGATPVGAARQLIAILAPGTTRYDLGNLSPSTTYRLEVRHSAGQQPGAGATIDVTTNALGNVCPPVLGFRVIQ